MQPYRRLRIAFVADTFDSAIAGGVRSALRFVQALRERHDVTVVAAGAQGDGTLALPAFYLPLVGRLMRENGFVFAVPRRRTLEALFRRVDVVHVQFPFWLGLRAAGIANAVGAPLVSAFHVQPENLLYNVGLRSARLVDWTYRLFLSRLFDRSAAVVCPSPFALEELRVHGLRAPAEVISNGIPPGFGPTPMERHERHRGKLLIVASGRLAREKRLDVTVEGVRRSRHADRIQLVVTGRGPEEEALRRRAATLPVPAEVGFVSEDELRRLLVTADLLVHASEVELEGMAVLEALACGTPALVARAPHSAARQFAVSEEFLFEPGDPSDLARRLDLLLDAPERLREARARCLALAAGFRFEDSVRRLEALYLRVARGSAVAG
ncbi:glycosyltransferase [Anaeromyxobacter sp. SG26]|uniref:glycosyltransferase n=1 Tax=Anaeromyxobacter sp. SG26 TaxID=2925407 RepID=UPI001F578D1C|nr:glycosyltransferase [Anaeromyxobacter sp. SG26]